MHIHDSVILEVIENTTNDTLDFIVDYPVDYNSNRFERKILRFYDYLNYQVQEMPFSSNPTILNFTDCEKIKYQIGEGRNQIDVNRTKIVLNTNAGKRVLEFEKVGLIDY